MKYVDRNGGEKQNLIKKYDVTDLIIFIFDLAQEDTATNPYSFYRNTWNGGAYDLKRYWVISGMAAKNNWIVYFDWEPVEPSNLWNLLAGFNMENSPISIWIVRDQFLNVEIENAKKQGYSWRDARLIANADEYTDSIWYDAGIKIHPEYITANREKKVSLIRDALSTNTIEYQNRSLAESELRKSLSHN